MPIVARPWLVPLAPSMAGAAIGGLASVALMPALHTVDPLGLSPIILIGMYGGVALGW
jgi:hypothetical protein